MIKRLSIGMLTLVSVLSLGVLPGCGRNGVTLNPDGSKGFGFNDRVTGDVVNLGEDVKIPEDFPSYIVRFPNAKVGIAIKDVAKNSYNTAQDVSEDVATVRQTIDRAYQSTDFKVANEFGSGDVMLFDYENATIRVHYQIARDNAKGKTNILIVSIDKTKNTQ